MSLVALGTQQILWRVCFTPDRALLLSACFLIAGLVNRLIYGSVHQFWPLGVTAFSFQAGK